MGWLILSGAPGAADYNGELQLIRHDGTAGESANLNVNNPNGHPSSGGASLSWASPYAFIGLTRGDPETAIFVIDRASFGGWPLARIPTNALGAGVLGFSGSGVYVDGGNFRTVVRNYQIDSYYAYTSVDGEDFFLRAGVSDEATRLVKGQNNRYLFFDTFNDFNAYFGLVYTDDYISFTDTQLPLTSIAFQYVRGAAGTSNGVWAFCVSDQSNTYKTYYSDDNLATFNSIETPGLRNVWAVGTTLYGAIAGRLYSSSDGATWADKGLPFGNEAINITKLEYDGTSTFLIVGSLGSAVTTTDFSAYTALPGYDFASHTLFDAIYVADNILYAAGGSTIQGTLRLDTSDGAFAARDVYLYNYVNGEKIAETVSDAVTGAWEFTQIPPGEYFVVGVAQGDDFNVPRDFDALGVITVI